MNQVNKKDFSILIVDDMQNMRRTIKNMLHSLGYLKITEAGDGDEAISAIESYLDVPTRRIQFVILDWNMPRVHGIEVLRHIKKNPRLMDIPVLMVTAEHWGSEIMEAAEDHVDGYIIKPFVTKTLEEKISKLLDRRYKPSELEKLMREGVKLMAAEEYDKAMGKFEEMLKIQPGSSRALRQLGKLYIIKGNHQKAEEFLKAAIDKNKEYTKAHKNLAELYDAMGRFDEALETLETAARINPRNHARLMLMGKLLLMKKRYDDIIELYQRVNKMGLSMKKWDMDLILAKAYMGAGNLEMVIESFKLAVKDGVDKNQTVEEIRKLMKEADIPETEKQKMEIVVNAL